MPAPALRALLCLAPLGACASGTALVPTPEWNLSVDATLSSTPQPGMDSPVPTELRIYQLRSLGAFEATAYEQLHEDDRLALGETLIARHTDRVFLYPARSWRGELAVAPGVRYVAIVAFLHRPVGRSWSYVAALPPSPAPGAMATPQQLAARPSGLVVTVGPDRVVGRPVFPPTPPPGKRQQRIRRPPGPRLPSAPQAPAPQLPSTPQPPAPRLPAAPQSPVPQLPATPYPPVQSLSPPSRP